MSLNKFKLLGIATFYATTSYLVTAQANTDIDALGKIGEFANRICTAPALQGSSVSYELNADAKIETSDLVKILSDLGIEGAAKYQSNEYSNVLQSELAQTISDSNNCRRDVLMSLKDHFFPAPPPVNATSMAGERNASSSGSSPDSACSSYAGPDGASSSCSSNNTGTSVSTFANERKANGTGVSANN